MSKITEGERGYPHSADKPAHEKTHTHAHTLVNKSLHLWTHAHTQTQFLTLRGGKTSR